MFKITIWPIAVGDVCFFVLFFHFGFLLLFAGKNEISIMNK